MLSFYTGFANGIFDKHEMKKSMWDTIASVICSQRNIPFENSSSFAFFEEPKNHKIFLDNKVCKKMSFSQSRLYIVMQGCDSM